jgi:hypothetical protein
MNDLAVRADLLGQGLDTIGSRAGVRQHLDPAAILNPVLRRYCLP